MKPQKPTAPARPPSPQPLSRRPEEGRARAGGIFPRPDEILDPRGPFLVPLLLLVLSRVAFWIVLPLAAEDAYITFRYARNLATGLGLVYNPGERVMGFSSPLWTAWVALGQLLVRDPLIWSRAMSLLADLATLLLMGAMLRRHASTSAAWAFGFFFAAWPFFGAVSASGMEMSFFLALIVLAAALVEARSPAAGVVLAAVALTRPEGLAAAFVLGLGAGWRDRLVALALVAAGLGLLAGFYGSVVPQSVVAKSRIYGTPGPWAGRHWWEWISPVVLGRWPSFGETTQLMTVMVVLAPAFVVGALDLWRRRAWALARTVAAPLTIWFGYAALGVAYFWWYLTLPLTGVAALAAVGLPLVVRGRAVAVALALFVLSIWSIVPKLYTARATEESLSFVRAAEILRAQAQPGEKALLEPIGIIGYRAPVTILDEVGLVAPAVAAQRMRGAGWYADLVREARPEWLLPRAGMLSSLQAFAGVGAPFRSAAERDSMLARYRVVDRGVESFGEGALLVLRRQP